MTAELLLIAILENNSLGISEEQVSIPEAYCMALNIYHEARSEPLAGQFAVAHTTLTRVRDSRYPSTVCNVVKQYAKPREDIPWLPEINMCQFSWYCDGKPDRIMVTYRDQPVEVNIEAFEVAATVALLAMSRVAKDNTQGATHYYNHNLVDPDWAQYYTPTVVYGNHTFLRRDKGNPK
jgi:spore germination cell wall hydrolase CwlJ-like protein